MMESVLLLNANPYFAQPKDLLPYDITMTVRCLQVPPDTPTLKIDAVSGANDQATIAGKEELAREIEESSQCTECTRHVFELEREC